VPQQVVQSCHASIEACKAFLGGVEEEHPSVIVFGIKTEKALKNVCSYLKTVGIKFCEFTEPDIGDELTSLATEPVAANSVRRYFKKYQLLKGC